MGVALAVVLTAFVVAHLWLLVGLARRGPWSRPLLALLAPPLAPWWGWNAGLRPPAIAWGAALVLYAIGVAVAAAR
jgi:hypothetical protein